MYQQSISEEVVVIVVNFYVVYRTRLTGGNTEHFLPLSVTIIDVGTPSDQVSGFYPSGIRPEWMYLSGSDVISSRRSNM